MFREANEALNTTNLEALRGQLLRWANIAESIAALWTDTDADWSMSWAGADIMAYTATLEKMYGKALPLKAAGILELDADIARYFGIIRAAFIAPVPYRLARLCRG